MAFSFSLVPQMIYWVLVVEGYRLYHLFGLSQTLQESSHVPHLDNRELCHIAIRRYSQGSEMRGNNPSSSLYVE
jgi:hypothetical protein